MSTPEKRQEAQQATRRRRIRRGYVVTVLISVGLSAFAILFAVSLQHQDQAHWQQALRMQQQQSQQQLRTMRHDLCGVIGPFAKTPAPEPTSPAQKAAMQLLLLHQKFVTLSGEFHC